MDFIIKMRVQPGDQHVSKGGVTIRDSKGVEMGQQVILEGETAETQLTVPPGGTLTVYELVRPAVFDRDQMATVPLDLTPGDPLTDPNRPIATPQTPGDNPRYPPNAKGDPVKPEPKAPELHPKDKTPDSGKVDLSGGLNTQKDEPNKKK